MNHFRWARLVTQKGQNLAFQSLLENFRQQSVSAKIPLALAATAGSTSSVINQIIELLPHDLIRIPGRDYHHSRR